MSIDKLQKELLTRRSLLLGAGKIGLLSVLLGRLFYLQIVQGKKYKTLADENRISTRPLLAERGMIVDRFGKPLAMSQETYRLLFMPEQFSYLRESCAELKKILPIDKSIEQLMQEFKARQNFPLVLCEELSWENVINVETRIADLPGVLIDKYKKRQYVNGPVLSSILGYVGPVSDKEQDKIKYCSPEQRIGKMGVEKQYDSLLQGEFGFRTVEVNARGRIVRELEVTPPKKGELITLTLDYDLQEYTYQRLGEMPAASVTLNAKNGDILALVSSPGYDPHLFLNGIRTQDWKNLSTHTYAPLINRVLQGSYAPGSIFKIVVALAAFERGLVKPQERISCCGHIDVGQHKFHCYAKFGHGGLNLSDALQKSCDVYFYTLADRIGVNAIIDMATRLGFGQMTGIDMPGEKPGFLPNPQWKKKRFKQSWHKGDTMMMGIGQSYLLATPLQLAVMMARIANGGYKIQPRLHQDQVEGGIIKPKDHASIEPLNISANSIRFVLDALNRVTNVEGGTGFRSRITQKGFEMAGKSSTTQVKSIKLEDRLKGLHKNENRLWHERDHAMFVGFAPVHDPQFVTVCIVEHGGWGSQTAAPIVRDILLKTQELAQNRAESNQESGATHG
jgi:penicillin-binding protein 2